MEKVIDISHQNFLTYCTTYFKSYLKILFYLCTDYVMLITWNRYSCWDIHMPTFFMTYSRQEEEVALLAEFLFFSRLNCFPNRRERKRRWAYSTISVYIYTDPLKNAWWWGYIHIHSRLERVGGSRFRSNYYKCPIAHDGLHALSCLITNDDEIARLPKLIIPKTFTCIGTIRKNLGIWVFLIWAR